MKWNIKKIKCKEGKNREIRSKNRRDKQKTNKVEEKPNHIKMFNANDQIIPSKSGSKIKSSNT